MKKQPRRPEKILYIEDHNESKLLVTRMLEAEGCDVVSCSDGVHGMELAESERPDLILVDMNLPFMDGYETATRLKALFPKGMKQLPVIATSVYSSYDEKDMAIAAGCDGFISKPIDVESFISTLYAYYNGRRDAILPERERDALVKYHRKLVKKLEAKAAAIMLDDETGLYNAKYLYKRIEEEMSRSVRLDEPFSITVITTDITGPPERLTLDEERRIALNVISDVLRNAKRLFDVAAKLDSGSFCVIVGGCARENASKVAERLCAKLHERTINLLDPEVSIRYRYGAKSYDGGHLDPVTLVESARQGAVPFH